MHSGMVVRWQWGSDAVAVTRWPHLVAGGRQQQQPEPVEAAVHALAATLLHERLQELPGGRRVSPGLGRARPGQTGPD